MEKRRGRWKEEDMKLAVEHVINKEMSIREASEQFSVPKSTLGDRLIKLGSGNEAIMKPHMGTFSNTFSDAHEEQLYNHVKALDRQLMPLTRDEFLKLSFDLAEHLNIDHRFNKQKERAGKDFYYEFMKRHPDLSLRSAESTSLQRAAGFNKEQVDRFYEKLTELMDKYSFSPSRIFNADETGVSCVHNNQLKVMTIKGKKQVGKLTSGERGRNVTVLLCINASGDMFVPPLFVFPRVRIDKDLTKDAPVGSVFDGQQSGWITKDGFLKWFKLFVERVVPSEKNPTLLIVDGHSSHKDLEVILFARSHHVHILSLPPHTTHKMQPLDRVVMKPFKNAFNEACSLWMRKYPKLKIALKDIAGLVNYALAKVCRMELAQSAFMCTGIYPLNRSIFTDLDFHTSLNDLPITVQEESPPCVRRQSSPEPSTSDQAVGLTTQQMSTPSCSRMEGSESTVLHTSAFNVVEQISPLPSSAVAKLASRKRRGDRSEVLTSSPYKNELEAKRCKLNVNQKSQTTKKLKGKHLRKTSMHRTPQPKVPCATNEETTDCIICGENFSEDWIQCTICKGWAHENCADLEGDAVFYKCDVCKKT